LPLFNRVNIGDINMDLAFMVIMDLFFIVDELSSLFGVTGDIGEGNGEFNFQVEFNGC